MTFRWIVLLTAILMVSLGCSGGRDTSHDVSEVPGGVRGAVQLGPAVLRADVPIDSHYLLV